ncbi:uncharacterized protein GGS25DRAFT_534420 [Hypoxylon fragiforme]|uniref:uncharacterized protein n=1 Tax=Hypoxylon fragiforme TaxID=63214 RepID=UPI0020C71E79|nr:uncharacterized protein GGS25DRAFT_534420 [Hypoxylon fragiforme]KAI2603834.1 hypothetical protein GGS25DRAFT_534420 [Hypoxylon fragiforme]
MGSALCPGDLADYIQEINLISFFDNGLGLDLDLSDSDSSLDGGDSSEPPHPPPQFLNAATAWLDSRRSETLWLQLPPHHHPHSDSSYLAQLINSIMDAPGQRPSRSQTRFAGGRRPYWYVPHVLASPRTKLAALICSLIYELVANCHLRTAFAPAEALTRENFRQLVKRDRRADAGWGVEIRRGVAIIRALAGVLASDAVFVFAGCDDVAVAGDGRYDEEVGRALAEILCALAIPGHDHDAGRGGGVDGDGPLQKVLWIGRGASPPFRMLRGEMRAELFTQVPFRRDWTCGGEVFEGEDYVVVGVDDADGVVVDAGLLRFLVSFLSLFRPRFL